MNSHYLDTNKSIIISSPAGSGKTEKLARRYIALLQKGVDAERILAITFTDKAAAEMKQRILRILKDEDKDLFKQLLEKMPLMRVSTIHSFCGTLLRRFSFEASIDPNYRIEDATSSRIAWEDILYEVLMDAGKGKNGHDILLQVLSEKGFRGLDYLKNTADYLFQTSPFSLEAAAFNSVPLPSHQLVEELKTWPGVKDAIENYEKYFKEDSSESVIALEKYFLTEKKEPRKRPVPVLRNVVNYRDWALGMYSCWKDKKREEHETRAERIREIYHRCLDKYRGWKKTKGTLDFSDLEYLAYKTLTENPEWSNILYAFDEKTDHVLVDEFQDTNTFQWRIINKLTEEWRSGLGAKREEGIRPTIFFVGDEKQSIYFFRGANVEIFQKAKEELEAWLGEEFDYEEVKENYRSLPALIDFTNTVFSRIMRSAENSPSWVTRYSPFSAYRSGIPSRGRVELILMDNEDNNIEEAKQREAEVLAQRIQELTDTFQITDKGVQQQRPCTYMDMAILLRKRTHLKKYEEALRKYNIPFVAVKGIGFYQEAEIAMLRALVFFLSNPRDDYSLYVLLKSPLFHREENEIIQLVNGEGDCLYTKLKNTSSDSGGSKGLNGSLLLLEGWLAQVPYTQISVLIEDVLVSTGAWRYFHEGQKRANIKKFIRLIEDLEASGKSVFKIRDFLERTLNRNEEPKANVNTEGMDAVKIMTIHAAKGLEFPIVFIPGLDEPFTVKTNDSLVYEKEGRFYFKSEPETAIRREDDDFLTHLAKEEEEQKRLFYVAVTRAEEALVLLSQWNYRDKSFLEYLKQGLGLRENGTKYSIESAIQGLSFLTEENVKMLYERAAKKKVCRPVPRRIEVIPLPVNKQVPWNAVTETEDIRGRHGKDWIILGDILHRIFEGISKGIIQEQDLRMKAEKLIESKEIASEHRGDIIAVIENSISTLRKNGIWQNIIMPREDSFSELPFVLESGDHVYTGRIDRIIKEKGSYHIYDYKTFPVTEGQIGYLLEEYAFQLGMYKKAVMNVFKSDDVKVFIIFTHTGDIREV